MSTPLREHIECGRHSGIPACCVAWYLTGWRALNAIDDVFGESEDFGDGIVMRTRGLTVSYIGRRPWGYVPCPVCAVLGRRVEVRSCSCDVDARMRE